MTCPSNDKRSVTFAPTATVKTILSRDDFTNEEKQSYWYTKQEIDAVQTREVQRLVQEAIEVRRQEKDGVAALDATIAQIHAQMHSRKRMQPSGCEVQRQSHYTTIEESSPQWSRRSSKQQKQRRHRNGPMRSMSKYWARLCSPTAAAGATKVIL